MSLKNFMETSLQTISVKAETASPSTSYFTNVFVAAWGAMTFNEVLMLIGTILALGTFGVNFYFQLKRNDREREKSMRESEYHSARMSQEQNRQNQNSEVDNGVDR